MTSPLRRAAPALAALAWLAVFSLLYTLGEEVGAWPKLPPGAFVNLDLYAGLIAGLVLAVVLLFPPTRKPTPDAG